MTSTWALPGATVSSMPSLAEGTQPFWYAKDVDDARAVVSQASQAEFSSNALEAHHEAIARLIGVFDRAQWVFHDWRALLHDCRVGCEPLLHALQDGLIDPAGNPATSCVSGALSLQGTSPAGTGGIVADMAAPRGSIQSTGQLLSRRAPVAVLFRVLGASLLATESTRGVS